MIERTPVGIKIWAGILILFGGFTSLITVLEIIDSIRFYGLDSILIISPVSLAGFFVYGVTPMLFYITGVGLFMSRSWARGSALRAIPLLFLLFVFNQAVHVARIVSNPPLQTPLNLLLAYPDIFLKFFIFYVVFAGPLILYFSRSSIRNFFILHTAA